MVKNLPAMQDQPRFWYPGREDPLEKGMATHSSLLFREFHEQKSLVGYSQWGQKESDMTEQPTLEISHNNIVYLIWFF